MTERDELFMRNTDAFSWYLQADPGFRATILAIVSLDERPDFDVLAARLERATRLARVFGSVRSSRRVDLRRRAGLTPELRSRAAVDQLPWIVWMKQATKEERWND
jgi:hypothetical protein